MSNPEFPLCGSKTKSRGKPCEKTAGWGTSHQGFGHCRYHLGNAPAMIKHAASIEAVEALAKMPMLGVGLDMKVDPHAAFIRLVNGSSSMVSWLELKIASFERQDQLLQEAGEYGPTVPSVWVKMLGDERDRLARFCKMAIDAGVAERSVRIAEQQGLLMAKVIQKILDQIGLSKGQQDLVPAIVRNVLLEMPALEAQLVEL